jgi:hypothetical protein
MHAAHFHPPRAIAATIIAAVLAIAITLAVATSLNDTSGGSTAPSGRSAPVLRPVPTPPWMTRSLLPGTGLARAWVASPFSPLLASPITPRWSVRGGS